MTLRPAPRKAIAKVNDGAAAADTRKAIAKVNGDFAAIEKKRAAAGVTILALCRAAEFTPSSYFRLKAGDNQPTARTIRRLKRALAQLQRDAMEEGA